MKDCETVDNKVESVKLRGGYRFEKITESFKIKKAKEILCDSKAGKYFSVAWKPGSPYVDLTRKVWICPACGKSFLDYESKISAKKQMDFQLSLISFFDDQIPWTKSTTKEGKRVQKIPHERSERKEVRFCRKCHKSSARENVATEKTLVFQKTHSSVFKILTITMTGIEAVRLMLVKKDLFDSGAVNFITPITEKVIFDFEQGTTKGYFLHGQTGEIVCATDFTDDPLAWKGPIFDALCEYHAAKRTMRKLFAELYGEKPPTPLEEINPIQYILLNRFQGFSPEFYSAIPFGQSMKLHSDFRDEIQALHNKNYAEIHAKNILPGHKVLGKYVFQEKPGLLFYMKELRSLTELLSADRVLSLLQSKNIYAVVAHLHDMPKIMDYFHALTLIIGEKNMTELLQHHPSSLFFCGTNYLLGDERRRGKWLDRKNIVSIREFRLPKLEYSLPLPSKWYSVQWIDGFLFRPSMNRMETIHAGTQLHNCLVKWYDDGMFDYPHTHTNLIVIYDSLFYAVAAIEVDMDREVMQAYLAHNNRLRENKEVFEAYCKWLKKNDVSDDGLKWR